MSQPVWTLSVDLQTRTATFTSGMADAAKAARGSFNDIKSGASEAGAATGYSMTEARHGVMLLGEEFGVHLPRALTSFVAGIGPVGAAMEAAFPFLAIAVGITLLLQHLAKLREEADKTAEAETRFGTTVNNVFTSLDNKLLEAGIRADELNQNHLAALTKQLELIDHQSLAELVHEFDVVAKAADATFAELKTHWYSIDAGSTGAKAALDHFKTQYESLLAQGKQEEAHGLLSGTLKQAREFLEQDLGHRGTEAAPKKEIESQEQLVRALEAQVEVEQKLAALKQVQDSNVQRTEANRETDEQNKLAESQQRGLSKRESAEIRYYKEQEQLRKRATAEAERDAELQARTDEVFQRMVTEEFEKEAKEREAISREEAQHRLKMGELQAAAEAEQARYKLGGMRGGKRDNAEEQIALEAANAVYRIKRQAFEDEIAALDKNGKQYEIHLRTLQNRETELTRAHENEITAIKDRAEKDRNNRVLSAERILRDELIHGLTDVLMRHQSFASMMGSLGDQVASGMLQNALKSIATLDMTKERQAAAAAREGWLAGMHFPFPADLVMAPSLAALGFASVMAYETGGIVPGSGNRDTVPAMLTPGEGVLPKALTEGLTSAARNGNLGGGAETHFHMHQINHLHAIDSTGVKQMLDKHKTEFSKHFHSELRKMNR